MAALRFLTAAARMMLGTHSAIAEAAMHPARAGCRCRPWRDGPRWCVAGALLLAAVTWIFAQTPATRPVATRPASRPSAGERAVNPHGSTTGCQSCHAMRNGRAGDIRSRDVEGICIKCHDGIHAAQERHPVGRKPTQATPTPRGWPMPDGKVSCVTCHQVHQRGLSRHEVPPRNPMFLRGYEGDLLRFCGKCHAAGGADVTATGGGRYNPHLAMLDKDGRPSPQGCTFCHTQAMPAGTAAIRTGRPQLHADGVTLCLGCHPTHVDWFSPGHIGANVSADIREALARFERTRHSAAADQPASTRPAAGELLPLGGSRGHTVVCGTCHNPHQQGVFAEGSDLAAGAMRTGQSTDQLRGLGKELCGVCHAK